MGHDAFKAFIIRKNGIHPRPQTLGQHLRNRRLGLDLRQEDVARQLGTLREAYERWERDERQPVVSEWPGILRFLDYYPVPESTQADLVLKARRCQGVDQKTLAKAVGVIHQRLRRWQHGDEIPVASAMCRLEDFARLPEQSHPVTLGYLFRYLGDSFFKNYPLLQPNVPTHTKLVNSCSFLRVFMVGESKAFANQLVATQYGWSTVELDAPGLNFYPAEIPHVRFSIRMRY